MEVKKERCYETRKTIYKNNYKKLQQKYDQCSDRYFFNIDNRKYSNAKTKKFSKNKNKNKTNSFKLCLIKIY